MSIELQKGLVLHQTFDEESLKSSHILGDKTPYCNDGVSANVPVFAADRMGQLNRAIFFSYNNNDVVTIPDSPELRPGINDFTLSFWIRAPVYGQWQYDGIITKGINTAYIAHTWGVLRNLNLTHSLRYIQSTDAGGATGASISIPLSDGWNFVFIRRTGSTVEVYNNDIFVDQDTSAGDNLNTTYPVKIGEDRSGIYIYATINEIRLYNRSLSNEEKTALYEMYRPKLSLGSLQKGLVGNWSLDQKSLKSPLVLGDKTPYSNDGISANVPVFTAGRTGQLNKAMSFNGSTDIINCGEGGGLFDFSTDFSISVWIKPGGTDNYNAILTKYGTNTGFDFILINGSVYMGLRGSSQITISTTDDLRDGLWHNISVLNTNSSIDLYVDNVKYTTTGTWIPAQNNSNLSIGYRQGLTTFNGSMEDLRIYNRLLSTKEVKSIFDS